MIKITIEGPQGAGKSALATLLAGFLRRTGLQVTLVNEDEVDHIEGLRCLGSLIGKGLRATVETRQVTKADKE